jgi:hypothetical protein
MSNTVILLAVLGWWFVGVSWKVVCSVCVVLCILPVIKKHLSDPYFVDFHTDLNSQGHDNKRARQTEWINMGYWKVRVYIKVSESYE